MIPLRDISKSKNFPWMTVLLMLANIGIFIQQVYYSHQSYELTVKTLGLVPYRFTHNGLHELDNLFYAMFMHGGWEHLLGNMLFLWVFGDNIEDTLGSFRFLGFYLLTGGLSFIAQIIMMPQSNIPLIGASGAISGILGGYLMMFPTNRILTLVPIIFFFTTVRIPALFFLGMWFLMQVVSSRMGGNVAWWAHIGGFITGFVLIRFFNPQTNRNT